ncbi:MAG: hypothetical protein KatS3mg060_1651 [Dehalococcoidia bacterium]|nr:MAG: hypothetical protein KatS3mg060_1651 [Dehalococcoidia bacterium]
MCFDRGRCHASEIPVRRKRPAPRPTHPLGLPRLRASSAGSAGQAVPFVGKTTGSAENGRKVNVPRVCAVDRREDALLAVREKGCPCNLGTPFVEGAIELGDLIMLGKVPGETIRGHCLPGIRTRHRPLTNGSAPRHVPSRFEAGGRFRHARRRLLAHNVGQRLGQRDGTGLTSSRLTHAVDSVNAAACLAGTIAPNLDSLKWPGERVTGSDVLGFLRMDAIARPALRGSAVERNPRYAGATRPTPPETFTVAVEETGRELADVR